MVKCTKPWLVCLVGMILYEGNDRRSMDGGGLHDGSSVGEEIGLLFLDLKGYFEGFLKVFRRVACLQY